MDKKKATLTVISFIIVLIACAGANHKMNSRKMMAIQLEWVLPLVEMKTGKVGELKDSCQIYYFEDLVLYRIPSSYKKYNEKIFSADTNSLVDDPATIEESGVSFENFIHKANAPTGYKYDNLKIKNHGIFNVDSIQKARMFKGANFYNSNDDKLVETIKGKNNILFEKYIPKVKSDASYNDTTYLIFNPKFKDVPYSLSREADSIKKMKLVEVYIIYNPIHKSPSNPIDIPRRSLIFKIKEMKIDNEQEIHALFERFKKDSEKLDLK